MLLDDHQPSKRFGHIVAGVSALRWRVYAHSRDRFQMITELGPVDHLKPKAQAAARAALSVDGLLARITTYIETEQVEPLMYRVHLQDDLERAAVGRRSSRGVEKAEADYRQALAEHIDEMTAGSMKRIRALEKPLPDPPTAWPSGRLRLSGPETRKGPAPPKRDRAML